MAARRPARMRERAVEPGVGETCEPVADLLARPGELVRAEALGRVRERSLDRVAQPALVVAARGRREDRHGPVESVLHARPDVVAEPEPLADLLEEARVRVGADDLD